MAVGFLASSVCVRQFTAIALATGMAAFFTIGLAVVPAVVRAFWGAKPWIDIVGIFSPLYSFIWAEGRLAAGLHRYWWSIVAVTGVSLVCLLLATLRVSLSWRDRAAPVRFWTGLTLFRRRQRNTLPRSRQREELESPNGDPQAETPPPHVGGYEASKHRTASSVKFRRRLLAINPFLWLAGRRKVSSPIFMLVTAIIVACASLIAAPYFGRVMRTGTDPMLGQLFAWFWATLAIHSLVLYYAAMVASQRLAEDKQTGALELVLSTPTTERSISRGLWMAYGRRMFFPAVVAILAHSFLIWQGATMCLLDPPQANFPQHITAGQLLWHAFFNVPLRGIPLEWGFIAAVRGFVLALMLLMLVWVTLGWVARWLGLRMKKPGFAPMASLAVVLAPPVVAFSFVCYLTARRHLIVCHHTGLFRS